MSESHVDVMYNTAWFVVSEDGRIESMLRLAAAEMRAELLTTIERVSDESARCDTPTEREEHGVDEEPQLSESESEEVRGDKMQMVVAEKPNWWNQ